MLYNYMSLDEINKTETYIGLLGNKYQIEYVTHWKIYGQGCHSTKYLYKGKIGSQLNYFWYIKDDLDLNTSPEQQEEYNKNFQIKWNVISGDIIEHLIKNL